MRQPTCNSCIYLTGVFLLSFGSLQEETVAHMRFLQDASFGMDSSVSFSYTGMSYLYSSMSLPYSDTYQTTTVEEEAIDERIKDLTTGEVVSNDITPLSQHQSEMIDVPVDLTTSTGGNQDLPQESSDFTNRTIAIAVNTVLATLAVLALAMIVVTVRRKKRAARVSSVGGDGTKCENSTVSADDTTAHDSRGSSV